MFSLNKLVFDRLKKSPVQFIQQEPEKDLVHSKLKDPDPVKNGPDPQPCQLGNRSINSIAIAKSILILLREKKSNFMSTQISNLKSISIKTFILSNQYCAISPATRYRTSAIIIMLDQSSMKYHSLTRMYFI